MIWRNVLSPFTGWLNQCRWMTNWLRREKKSIWDHLRKFDQSQLWKSEEGIELIKSLRAEDGGSTFLWNVKKYTMQKPQYNKASNVWKAQHSGVFAFLHLFCTILYFHLQAVWLCQTFPHYLINGTIVEKGYWRKMRILTFSTTFVLHIPHLNKNSVRYYQKYTDTFI
jgi:hypothetical protein